MSRNITFLQDAPPDIAYGIKEELAVLQENKSGYKSWGSVHILGVAIRKENNEWIRVFISEDEKQEIFASVKSISGNQLPQMIFKNRRKINVVLFTQQVNASRVFEEIPPILDDQAQLLGPSLRYVKEPDNSKNIVSALRGRYAANLSNGKTICIGKNLEDAYIAAQLVEKTSKAFLEAKHLGGAKSINRFEAWAMHKFYMFKYSKEAEKNR